MKWWTMGKDMEGSGQSLFQGSAAEFAEEQENY
jgi:hypothetical protein